MGWERSGCVGLLCFVSSAASAREREPDREMEETLTVSIVRKGHGPTYGCDSQETIASENETEVNGRAKGKLRFHDTDDGGYYRFVGYGKSPDVEASLRMDAKSALLMEHRELKADH